MDQKPITKTAVRQKVGKVSKKNRARFLLAPYTFIAPFFITFLVFSAFPIFYSLFLSFYSWNGIREMRYVGLDNYLFILTKDAVFWKAMSNTFIMNFASAIPQHVLALAFAFILNQGLVKAKEFFKGVMFLPYITSTVAITMIFTVFFGRQNYGLINNTLRLLQDLNILDLFGTFQIPIEFLREPWTWFVVSFIIFWQWTGWNVIIYLAGLQSISQDVYDAARIDGATWFQIFYQITLPMLKPVIYFATSMSLIYGLQIFDAPVVLLGIDGALYENYNGITSVSYMYIYAFKWGKFGVATASSYALCLVILIMTMAYRKIMNEGEV